MSRTKTAKALEKFAVTSNLTPVLTSNAKIQSKLGELTEQWWLSGLMCQSIINPMLSVEGSNLGASILKFSIFQFSKWLCLDKNNNLGISVALLVLND